jgi:hypothetical protein
MGIQINGNTDTITAIDGALTVSGAELSAVTNLNATGIVTASGFVGDITGNVNSSGVSTVSSLNVGIGGTILTVISNRGIGIGTNTYASLIQARFAVSNSSETFEFSPGWDTYNGGVIEYVNRSSNTTRPDLNFYTTASGNGSIKFWTGGSERFRITGIGGSVGIGITTPLAPLHLNSTANPAVVIGPSVSTRSSSDVGFAKTFFVYVDRQPSLPSWGDGTNRDTLFTDSLYVRTPVRDNVNNPAIVIAENGGQASGRNSLVFWNDDGNSGRGYTKARIYTEVGGSYAATKFFIDVADSSRNIQNRFAIDVNGTFTGSASNDISDARLKKNIKDIENPIEKIKALKGRTFEWQERASMAPGTKYGFIAQEVEEIIPDLVLNETGLRIFDENDNIVEYPDYKNGTTNYSKSVQSTGIIPVLVEALKEALEKIETLEAEVAALKAAQ